MFYLDSPFRAFEVKEELLSGHTKLGKMVKLVGEVALLVLVGGGAVWGSPRYTAANRSPTGIQ